MAKKENKVFINKDLLGKESTKMYIEQVQNQLMDTIQMIAVHDQIQDNCKKALTWDKDKDADLLKQIEINKENLKKNLDNKDYFEKKIAFWQKIQSSKAKLIEIPVSL